MAGGNNKRLDHESGERLESRRKFDAGGDFRSSSSGVPRPERDGARAGSLKIIRLGANNNKKRSLAAD